MYKAYLLQAKEWRGRIIATLFGGGIIAFIAGELRSEAFELVSRWVYSLSDGKRRKALVAVLGWISSRPVVSTVIASIFILTAWIAAIYLVVKLRQHRKSDARTRGLGKSPSTNLSDIAVKPVIHDSTTNVVGKNASGYSFLVSDLHLVVCFQNAGASLTLLSANSRIVDASGKPVSDHGGLQTVQLYKGGHFANNSPSMTADDLKNGKFIIPGQKVSEYFTFMFASTLPNNSDIRSMRAQVLFEFLEHPNKEFMLPVDVGLDGYHDLFGAHRG